MKSAKVLLSQSEKVKFAVIWKLFVLSKANVVKQKGSQQDSKQFIQIYPEQISICIFVFLHSVIWSTKQVQIIIYRHKMKKRTAVVQIARCTQQWHYRLSQGRWQSERYWRRWETGNFQEEGWLGSFVLIPRSAMLSREEGELWLTCADYFKWGDFTNCNRTYILRWIWIKVNVGVFDATCFMWH